MATKERRGSATARWLQRSPDLSVLVVAAGADRGYSRRAQVRLHFRPSVMPPLLKYWLPVLIWLGVIFIGSSDMMSAEHTSRIIAPLLRWLRPDISPETIATVQFYVRKAAHLTEYAILAMLLGRAMARGVGKWSGAIAVFVVIAAGVVAAADEYHQSFVQSRTSSPGDVLIDICGAIVGLPLFQWLRNLRSAGRDSVEPTSA